MTSVTITFAVIFALVGLVGGLIIAGNRKEKAKERERREYATVDDVAAAKEILDKIDLGNDASERLRDKWSKP